MLMIIVENLIEDFPEADWCNCKSNFLQNSEQNCTRSLKDRDFYQYAAVSTTWRDLVFRKHVFHLLSTDSNDRESLVEANSDKRKKFGSINIKLHRHLQNVTEIILKISYQSAEIADESNAQPAIQLPNLKKYCVDSIDINRYWMDRLKNLKLNVTAWEILCKVLCCLT